MSLPQLIIIGAGGFGREVLAWAGQSLQVGREWAIKGFIDDNLEALRERPAPAPVLGRIEDHQPASDEVFICALGVPALKRRCSEMIVARGGRFVNLVHRTVVMGYEVRLGAGVVLCPHSVVSSNTRLGRGVAINLHSTVDHDAVVGDWTQVNCHCDLTAGVSIGAEVFLGSRVTLFPGVRVGDRAHLGGGSVVTRDVPEGVKVFGNPAKRVE